VAVLVGVFVAENLFGGFLGGAVAHLPYALLTPLLSTGAALAPTTAALPNDRDATIALYCRSGSMSAEASAALLKAGYTDVRDLDGGMIAWEQSGRDLLVENR